MLSHILALIFSNQSIYTAVVLIMVYYHYCLNIQQVYTQLEINVVEKTREQRVVSYR